MDNTQTQHHHSYTCSSCGTQAEAKDEGCKSCGGEMEKECKGCEDCGDEGCKCDTEESQQNYKDRIIKIALIDLIALIEALFQVNQINQVRNLHYFVLKLGLQGGKTEFKVRKYL